MRFKIFFIALVIVISPSLCLADSYTFAYDANCSNAYQYYMSLRFAEGNAAVKKAIISNPYNLMPTYIADYADCLQLMLNCNKADYEQLKDHYNERLDLLDKGDKNSPYYRLCKAGIYLHWALIHYRFGENYKAATIFRKSYQMIKENQELFPRFEYNNIYLGVEQTITGTIPDGYKWVANIIGLKGDVKKGVARLEGFVNSHGENDFMRQEAQVFLLYLKFYLMHEKQEEVWNYINSPRYNADNNLLKLLVKANVAVNYRKADVAIQTLQTAAKQKGYSQFPFFDYEMGSAMHNKLDLGCVGYFLRFLKNYKGDVYLKDTREMMALIYYASGNAQYASYYRNQIKTAGTTLVDADKQAKRFSENTDWPNVTLLQARLLIDGGYYTQALNKLAALREQDLKTVSDKLEYYFRLGRAYDELNNEAKALQYYQATINMGKDRKEHFAARAALQMGFMYEHRGNAQQALAHYKEALSMRDHDFQNSIDQQAKAGLNRLGS